eukprot:5475287-Prymnesium_polylepis.1
MSGREVFEGNHERMGAHVIEHAKLAQAPPPRAGPNHFSAGPWLSGVRDTMVVNAKPQCSRVKHKYQLTDIGLRARKGSFARAGMLRVIQELAYSSPALALTAARDGALATPTEPVDVNQT